MSHKCLPYTPGPWNRPSALIGNPSIRLAALIIGEFLKWRLTGEVPYAINCIKKKNNAGHSNNNVLVAL